jgi:DNA repair protein RadC
MPILEEILVLVDIIKYPCQADERYLIYIRKMNGAQAISYLQAKEEADLMVSRNIHERKKQNKKPYTSNQIKQQLENQEQGTFNAIYLVQNEDEINYDTFFYKTIPSNWQQADTSSKELKEIISEHWWNIN